jgi:hypothetical protein
VSSIEETNNQDPPVTLFAHIAARFEQIELSHWTVVVFIWLARYDGLHCISELEHGTSDDEVAHALSHLAFLTWRVRHPETAERWDPLSLSLCDFIGKDLSPNCWKWEGTFPSSPVIASWLIEQHPHR